MTPRPDGGGPTRILITHFYSRTNKGDAALASVLISELRRQFGDPELSLLTPDRTEPGETFEGVPLESNFAYLSSFRFTKKVHKLGYAIALVFSTVVFCLARRRLRIDLWLPTDLRKVVQRYADADLVIPVGGGYMGGGRTVNSIFNTVLTLHPLVLAWLLGKPTVVFSQSFGPYKYRIERLLVRWVLNTCVILTLVREDESMAFLHGIGVPDPVRSVDSGFLLDSGDASADLRSRFGLPADQLLIGVTGRHWLDPDPQDRYESAVAQTIDHLCEHHDAHIVFVPQVTAAFFDDDDRVANRSIADRTVHRDRVHVLEDELDPHEVKAVIEDIDLMIGTRFHSIIFSLTSYVPAVAIQYNHKASGIMSDLDLGDWLIMIDQVTEPALTALCERLIAEAPSYRKHLRAVIPPYQEEARRAVVLAQDAFDWFVRRDPGPG